jgi:hypothetical protein
LGTFVLRPRNPGREIPCTPFSTSANLFGNREILGTPPNPRQRRVLSLRRKDGAPCTPFSTSEHLFYVCLHGHLVALGGAYPDGLHVGELADAEAG